MASRSAVFYDANGTICGIVHPAENEPDALGEPRLDLHEAANPQYTFVRVARADYNGCADHLGVRKVCLPLIQNAGLAAKVQTRITKQDAFISAQAALTIAVASYVAIAPTVPAVDENGNPILDDSGNQLMIPQDPNAIISPPAQSKGAIGKAGPVGQVSDDDVVAAAQDLIDAQDTLSSAQDDIAEYAGLA